MPGRTIGPPTGLRAGSGGGGPAILPVGAVTADFADLCGPSAIMADPPARIDAFYSGFTW